ncbi:MAG: alkaline phosphatase family protein [Bacteroidia bacterium]|nr:alkaline phosphatase family protein [Bacteroidia bacterium]
MRKIVFLSLICLFAQMAVAQQSRDLLLSGPMVGYTEMREALLWVQTNGSAKVQFRYQAQEEGAPVFATEPYFTRKEEAFTARFVCDLVKPGKKYAYRLLINDQEVQLPYELSFKTPPLWQYRTDPPEMNIALGSCVYINDTTFDRPGRPYGGGYEIFSAIHEKKPDMMLWLGDNNYLREVDFYSTTGIVHRYTHSRNVPEMQPLLASTSNYAIWDDHDYGTNDSDRSYREKNTTLAAFQLFWGNPSYGLGHGGITSMFQHGDADFFMLDNRYFRTPNNRHDGPRTVLGEEQLQWFLDALVSSQSTFKFVMIGGQVLNTYEVFENYVNLAPNERRKILDFIVEHKIKNVIFLTGDRHHSEMSMMERDGLKIYDFTSSPLTSGTHDALNEPNLLRVEGSHVAVRNFGMMNISGPRLERKVRFSFHDATGKELWTYEIAAQ